MKAYTALYREIGQDTYSLLAVFTADFLRREVDGDWLHDLIVGLSEGDLWAIQVEEYDSLDEVKQFLEGE